jgi:hypothetical protein
MSAAQKRYKYGSVSFPILFEGYGIRVFRNPSGEIFVEDVESGVTMRLSQSHYPGGGIQFTTEGFVEPIRVTNMIGWRVANRTR